MIYWYLTLAVGLLLVCLGLMYAALRGLVYGAFRWHRSRALLQKLGYPGPVEMLSRILWSLLWTTVAIIGLVLVGLLFTQLQ